MSGSMFASKGDNTHTHTHTINANTKYEAGKHSYMKMKLNVEHAGPKINSKFQMQLKLFFLTIVIYTFEVTRNEYFHNKKINAVRLNTVFIKECFTVSTLINKKCFVSTKSAC